VSAAELSRPIVVLHLPALCFCPRDFFGTFEFVLQELHVINSYCCKCIISSLLADSVMVNTVHFLYADRIMVLL